MNVNFVTDILFQRQKTLYCYRVFKDDKTCKQIDSTLKYKRFAENDLVLKTFEKEKNKMYKRMDRNYSFRVTPKSISYDENADWLNKAINVNIKHERVVYMKVAIYSRKSLFTGKGESVENQIEMCRQYIKFSMADVEVADDDIFIYEDEGYSAKDLKRPQFQQMMKDLDTYNLNISFAIGLIG